MEKIQSERMSAGTVVKLYNSLINFVEEMKCSFEVYKNIAETKLKSVQQLTEKEETRPKRGVKRTGFLMSQIVNQK